MPSLKDNKTCVLLEQYLNYLTVVKRRSPLTAEEYRVDCLMLFEYIKRYWQASGESIKTSIRTKTRLSQIVEEGRFRGGGVPYGFRIEQQGRLNKKGHPVYEILVDETEAPVVKMIFDKYLNEGYGSQRICTFLQKQGITNRAGSNFTNTTIQHML